MTAEWRPPRKDEGPIQLGRGGGPPKPFGTHIPPPPALGRDMQVQDLMFGLLGFGLLWSYLSLMPLFLIFGEGMFNLYHCMVKLLTFFKQGLRAKSLPYISEQIWDWDFSAMLKLPGV